MVYTVTFNPAIDYLVQTEGYPEQGKTNRSIGENMFYGGKGINVSMVLNELGINSTALGFIAGFTGKAIKEGLTSMGITTDFIELGSGNSRINVKLKSMNSDSTFSETEINGQGPAIDEASIELLMDKLCKLKKDDILVISGSVPNSLPDDIYEVIMAKLSEKEIKFIVDASGRLLLNALAYAPFLIKPNMDELNDIVGRELKTEEEIIDAMKELQLKGAENVLVSMGAKGALLLCDDGTVIEAKGCDGTVVNSVGAGDSMIAGFIGGYIQYMDFRKAMEIGGAAGSATAFKEGLATRADIQKYRKTVEISYR